jgi:hypothetical protein
VNSSSDDPTNPGQSSGVPIYEQEFYKGEDGKIDFDKLAPPSIEGLNIEPEKEDEDDGFSLSDLNPFK